jgi:hypothetical protein
MEILKLDDHIIDDCASYFSSIVQLRDACLHEHVQQGMAERLFWIDPLIHLSLLESWDYAVDCAASDSPRETFCVGTGMEILQHGENQAQWPTLEVWTRYFGWDV